MNCANILYVFTIVVGIVSSTPIEKDTQFLDAKSSQPDLVTSVSSPGMSVERSPKSIAADSSPKKSIPATSTTGGGSTAKSSAKPADLDKARTILTGYGMQHFLQGFTTKLPSYVSPYQVTGLSFVKPSPITTTHYVQPQPIIDHQVISSAPFIPTLGHHQSIIKPAPSYAISQQIIHKPILTEIQEVYHKPVYTELQEVVHKPVFTEVQQVVKKPVFTEHVIKHPSYNAVHQEVVEKPLHLQTEQYHVVAKPFSQIVQLPVQQIVQPIVNHIPLAPVVNNVVSSAAPVSHSITSLPVTSVPVSSSVVQGTGGGHFSSYGFGSHGPITFPWGFTKPFFTASPIATSSSAYTAPLAFGHLSAPVVSTISPGLISSSAGYTSADLSGPTEYQFLTASTCRSGSCGQRAAAVDVAEMPLNYQPADYYPNVQSMGTMPISNLIQNDGMMNAYSQPPTIDYNSQAAQEFFHPQFFQPSSTMFTTNAVSGMAKGDQDNVEKSSNNVSAKAAEYDNSNADQDGVTRILVPSGNPYESSTSSGKPYPPISLTQYLRDAIDVTEQSRNALDSDAKNLEYVLKKVQESPEAMEKIKNILNDLINSFPSQSNNITSG